MTRLLFIAFLVVLSAPTLHAQGCCTAGSSSLSGFESGTQKYRTLSLSAGYQYNSLTRAYQGTENIDDPLKRTAEVAFFSLQAEYGLQPRLSVLASLYYSDKNRELTVQSGQGIGRFEETAKFRGSGVGDLTLLAKYELVHSRLTSPFALAIGGGVTMPTGSYTEEVDGSRLSIDLQPGTGAVNLIAWGYASYGIPETGLTFSVTGSYRYSSTNPDGYRLSDEILLTYGGEKSLGENFSAALFIRSRFGEKDFAGGRFLIGTGGTFHDLFPNLSYVDGPSLVRLFGQLPLYRNVRGLQLTTSYMLGAEYTYVIDFRDAIDIVVPEI